MHAATKQQTLLQPSLVCLRVIDKGSPSIMSVLHGPVIISPVVTRFFWPPLMPLSMLPPTRVSDT